MNKQNKIDVLIAVLLVIVAAVSRVIMYPHNFSPMIGMAIFAGAIFTDKKLAFALPLAAMLLSDVLFEVLKIAPGFWGWGQVIGYAIFALITLFATSLKKLSWLNVAGFSIASSTIFFILSNLSFFVVDNPVYHTYTQNFNGIINCYISALPFFKTSLLADLVYSGILFGSYYTIKNIAFKKSIA